MCQPRTVFLATALPFLAAVVGLAAAPEPATKVKPVQVEIDAPVGCANAKDFLNHLRLRTHLVRQATGDEPHTTLEVRLVEMRRQVTGELRVVDDRGESDTRKVQGANCDDVVQALALAAAVALDPSVLLPATVTVPASATTAPANPPPAIAPAVVEQVGVPKSVNLPDSGASRIDPRFALGAASMASSVVSSGISPGVAVFGRWTPVSIGAFRPTLGLAALYLRNDLLGSPGAAQVSLAGLAATLCGTGWGTGRINFKPCALLMGGLLSVRGQQAIRTSSVALLWLSTGVVARTAVNLGRGFSLDLEAGVSAPFFKRAFYTTLPSHVVEKTSTISPVAGVGLAYGL